MAGHRYMSLEKVLRYTGLSVDTLKNLVEFGHLPFINSGNGPVFDVHDVQKAMHKIKTDGISPVMEHFGRARIAEIDEATDQKREAAKDKPPAEPVELEIFSPELVELGDEVAKLRIDINRHNRIHWVIAALSKAWGKLVELAGFGSRKAGR